MAAKRKKRMNIKRIPAVAMEKTVRALELTPDVLSGMAHFELSGNREVVVDGCRGILEYDENVIRLLAGKLTVRFTGRGLELRNLRKDSAIIEGFITAIEFST
jgi:sporulation protein YqfC